MTQFTPFKHQVAFSRLWGAMKRVLNFDACGTGKTLSCIHAVKVNWPGARVLVACPLSTVETAWGDDLKLGWPEATKAFATGGKGKKLKAINGGAQWVITNHDTVKLIASEKLYSSFDVLIVDEADAFRNESDRTKALRTLSQYIPIVNLMTGTPTPRSITDIFNLALTVDFGERLGKRFTKFRNEVCNAYPQYGAPPGVMRYEDKPEAYAKVMAALADITTRVELSAVTELPETIKRTIRIPMPRKLQKLYEQMAHDSVMALEQGTVTAINAAARRTKLLQLMSGSVYDGEQYHDIHPERHELVIALAMETDHALVAFNWKHQRDGLVAEARKKKLRYAVIDGTTSKTERPTIIRDFQAGKYDVLFAHPQSAGHGITLTKANRVIWASPTDRTDLFEQFNHRIVRNGQKRKTEIIMLAAEDTVEEVAYGNQLNKRDNMFNLLDAFAELAKVA